MLRDMSLAGARVRVGQAIDLNVLTEHRSVGPALKLQRSLIDSTRERGIPLVYAVPSKNADPIMRRIGYRVVGRIERWVRPLRSEYKVRERLRFRPLVKPVSLAIDQALRLLSAERTYRRPQGTEVEHPTTFDDRFDRLWMRAASQFAVAGERTQHYLRWRYERCPDAAYRTLCLTDARHELTAYVVYSTDDDGFACISDLLFVDERALDVLLAEFLRHLRGERISSVCMFYFGSSRVSAALRRFGFSSRFTERQLYVYIDRSASPADSARVMDRENWFFTKADSDTDV
jgi:hypothetical protein